MSTIDQELITRGWDVVWWGRASADLRLTVEVLRAKLVAVGLWDFVGREASSSIGCLEFDCTDVAALRRVLRLRPDFSDPSPRDDRWSSRELRRSGSLHLKHFRGWPSARVQAHIDLYGLRLPGGRVSPLLALQHARHWRSYQDVGALRDLMVAQGVLKKLQG